MAFKPFTPGKYRRRIFSQLWMLALQFLLGMVLNFFGPDVSGGKRILAGIVLVLHILNAIGLVEGGIYIALKERSALAWRAAWAMFLTLIAGVLTLITKQDAWSFVMSAGFIGGSAMYVVLYVRADRAVRQQKAEAAS